MDAVSVSGAGITYRQAGSGDPLVLLHGGFGFDSRSWRPQLDGLADGFRVVAWDAPGCGGSDDPPGTFRMADYADRLAGFVDAVGLERPHVLGISFGAALALAFYDRYPARVRSLVLAGGYAGWAGSLPAEEVRRRLERISEELTRPPEVWLPAYLPGMFAEPAPADLLEQASELASGIRPPATRTMLHAMAEADLTGVLPRIRVPTLVLHGERDSRSPLAVGRDLHRRIPGSRLVVLPGVGHLSSLEAAEAFNRAVRAFLRTA
jgi:pimeloyl-ACP methyl ester carboxylesterase